MHVASAEGGASLLPHSVGNMIRGTGPRRHIASATHALHVIWPYPRAGPHRAYGRQPQLSRDSFCHSVAHEQATLQVAGRIEADAVGKHTQCKAIGTKQTLLEARLKPASMPAACIPSSHHLNDTARRCFAHICTILMPALEHMSAANHVQPDSDSPGIRREDYCLVQYGLVAVPM